MVVVQEVDQEEVLVVDIEEVLQEEVLEVLVQAQEVDTNEIEVK